MKSKLSLERGVTTYNLTIIIPHYNSLATLEYLLSTIPEKQDIQIVVVDDNSSFTEIDKEQLKVFIKRENTVFLKNDSGKKGAGACRNIGLEQALGKWILFADADDYFLEGFIEEVEKFYRSANDIVFFTPTSIELDTLQISDRHIRYSSILENYTRKPDFRTETFIRFSFFVPWSKLFRKSFIDENSIRFDETLASNDIMFSTKAGFHMEKFEVASASIYCVTRSRGSLTMKLNQEIYFIRLYVFLDYWEFLRRNITSEQLAVLNVNGRWLLAGAVEYKLRLIDIFKVYIEIRKNKLPIFELKLINPLFFFNKTIYFFNKHKKDKKYYAK